MPEKQTKKEIIQGKGKITFVKETREAKIRSPLQNFEEVKQQIEYRRDPITNHFSRINTLRAERVKQAAAAAMGDYIDYFTEPIWEQRGEEEEEE